MAGEMDVTGIVSPPLTQSQSQGRPIARVISMLQDALSKLNKAAEEHAASLELHQNKTTEDLDASFNDTATEPTSSLTPDVVPKRVTLRKDIRKLQNEDDYNLIVHCKGMSSKTTVDILRLHSGYFRKYLPPQKTGDNLQRLHWDQTELFAAERFLDFVYKFDYGPREMYSNPPAADATMSDAEIHIGVYRLAQQWIVPRLMGRAKAKFDAYLGTLAGKEDMSELLDLVPILYERQDQQPAVIELQRSLVEAWAGLATQQLAALSKDRLKNVFARFSEFSIDVMMLQSRAATPMAPRKRKRMEQDRSSESRASPDSLTASD